MSIHWDAGTEPIPGYRLIEKIGRGGYGEVWRAQAPGGLHKAIKFVFGEICPTNSSQANQELRALERIRDIRHPFVLSTERFDIVEGQLCVVMELADRDLTNRLAECNVQGLVGVPRQELLRYLDEAADALDTMSHRFNLQHLDIKPQNLFLVDKHLKIADFGLVRTLEGKAAAFTGGITPIYACPESFDGWVSRTSDQYSLAIVYQEMLTGQLPFLGPSPRQYMLQHLTREPDLSSLPEDDRPVIKRALAKRPEERFETCAEFVEALKGKRSAISLPISSHDQPEIAEEMSQTLPSSGALLDAGLTSADSGSGLSADRRILVIALGGTGCQFVRRIRSAEEPSSLKGKLFCLAIDTDPHSLEQLPTSSTIKTVHCPFKRGNHYLKHWSQCGHLKPWLDPNLLFQTSRNGDTNGHRPLGRLAFWENIESIEATIRDWFTQLADDTEDRLQVYVVADMMGGAGSGMFLDTCYSVRKLATELAVNSYELTGMLHVSTSVTDSKKTVNVRALSDEIDYLIGGKLSMRRQCKPEAKEEVFGVPPADRILLISTNEETERRDGLENASQLMQSLLDDEFSYALDQLKLDQGSVVLANCCQVEFPDSLIARHCSFDVMERMVETWLEPLPSGRLDEVFKSSIASLKRSGFDKRALQASVQAKLDGLLAEPLQVEIAQTLAELEEAVTFENGSVVADRLTRAFEQVSDVVGSDWDVLTRPATRQTPLHSVAERTIDRTYRELAESLTEAVLNSLTGSGSRWTRSNVVLQGFDHYFVQSLDQLHSFVRGYRQQLARKTRAINDATKEIETMSPVPARTVLSVIEAIREYAQAKIDIRLAELSVQVLLRLRTKLGQLKTHLEQVGDQLRQWRQRFHDQPLEVPNPTGNKEFVFPDGISNFKQMIEHVNKRLLDRIKLSELDDMLDGQRLTSLGGLWSASTAQTADLILHELLECTEQWVAQHLPAHSAVDCITASQASNAAFVNVKIQQFIEWASPVPRSTDVDSTSTIVELPSGASSKRFEQALREAIDGPPSLVVNTSDRFAISRLVTTNRLSSLVSKIVPEDRLECDSTKSRKSSAYILSLPDSIQTASDSPTS